MLRAQFQSIINNYSESIKEMEKNMLNFDIVDQLNIKVKEQQTEIEVLRLEIQGFEVKEK